MKEPQWLKDIEKDQEKLNEEKDKCDYCFRHKLSGKMCSKHEKAQEELIQKLKRAREKPPKTYIELDEGSRKQGTQNTPFF